MLRGINIGKHKRIKMDALKALYASLGFKKSETYIQSGNVVFECSETDIPQLVSRIEDQIKANLGFYVPVLIRRKRDFEKLIKNVPFPTEDPKKLNIVFLSDAPIDPPIEKLNELKTDSEEFLILGKEIYLYSPEGYSNGKLSNNLFEKKLKLSGTTRNWRTVNALLEMAG